jgi:hypothetical protein
MAVFVTPGKKIGFVFRKENGKWKMVGHHADILPYLEK